MQNNVLILDFGSQYTQLIARRVRELNIYCEIHPYHHIPESLDPFKAVILFGQSVFRSRGGCAPPRPFTDSRSQTPFGGLLRRSVFGTFQRRKRGTFKHSRIRKGEAFNDKIGRGIF